MSELGYKKSEIKPEPKEKISNIVSIQLAGYIRPDIKEVAGQNYVLNGPKNSFYKEIIDRYNGSPTNRTIIDSYAKFIYGKGLTSKQKNTKPIQFATVLSLLSKKDNKAICFDYKLFGEASVELIYKNGMLQKVKHVSKQRVVPSKMDEKGDILSYWYSLDFEKTTTAINKPIEIEAWYSGGKKTGSYIFIIDRYQVGKTYFTDPDYMAGIPYATLEEEISNYYVNHIKNGLSTGHIVNMNNGEPGTEEIKRKVKADFIENATGSTNAGRFVLNFCNKDNGITIEALTVSDAHKQYEVISGEATQKLMIAHKVVSPIIFGVKDNTGFGNNAQEMESAFNETMINVIQPMQEDILDAYMQIFTDAGLNIDLDFMPLRVPSVKEGATATNLSAHDDEVIADDLIADSLIGFGEVVDETEWELIDCRRVDEKQELSEVMLTLASVPSSFPNVKSEEDTPLFKVRYEYAGS